MEDDQGSPGHGFLTPSPALFAKSSNFVHMQPPPSRAGKAPYRMSSYGIEIQLYLTCTLQGGEHVALLDYQDTEFDDMLAIYVSMMQDSRFVRTRLDQLAIIPWVPENDYKLPTLETFPFLK
jgi:hypothetical protein